MTSLFSLFNKDFDSVKEKIFQEIDINTTTKKKKYGDAKVVVTALSYDDLIFSPLSQLKCVQCGFFGRTYYCGPWIPPYYKWRELLKDYNIFLLISGYIDVTPRIDENINKYGTSSWKAHYYAGNEGTSIIKSAVDKRSLYIANVLKSFSKKRVINFDSGGGCRRCRKCGKYTGEKCKHPEEALVSPEAAGIELYTMMPQLFDNFQIPPQNVYWSVRMVVAKIPDVNIGKSHNIIVPHTPIEVPEAKDVYNVNDIYNPDVARRCESCHKKSSHICNRKFIRDDDLFDRIKSMKIYEVYLKNSVNTVSGIRELYQHSLDLHRKGYWWVTHLTKYGCSICTECNISTHMDTGYKKVTNRHIPFCTTYFNLDLEPKNNNVGYILV